MAAATGPQIQFIKRTVTVPPLSHETPKWFRDYLMHSYTGQQLNLVHSAFQQFQVVVAGAAATTTVTFTFPYSDTKYVAHATPTWNTTVFILTPATDLLKGSVKFTYGAAAPGGGGTLFVLTVR